MTDRHFAFLKPLLTTKPLSLPLLYKSSHHGPSASDFHVYCDYQGPTITIVKSSLGRLFGGFAEKSWNSEDGYIKGEGKSFLF
jgi:hypothetical protein